MDMTFTSIQIKLRSYDSTIPAVFQTSSHLLKVLPPVSNSVGQGIEFTVTEITHQYTPIRGQDEPPDVSESLAQDSPVEQQNMTSRNSTTRNDGKVKSSEVSSGAPFTFPSVVLPLPDEDLQLLPSF